jgi:4-hydroxy-3-methylbut-2-enyl diphosphate reductase
VESVADAKRLEIKDPDRLAFVTQTTLSMDETSEIIDALRARFPNILGPHKKDICYATQNRQDAVKRLVDKSDLMLVVGSPNSSNSNRLREIAEKKGVEAYLIDGPEAIEDDWLRGKRLIAVTAGASAPEILVEQVVEVLRNRGAKNVQEHEGIREHVVFIMPKALR